MHMPAWGRGGGTWSGRRERKGFKGKEDWDGVLQRAYTPRAAVVLSMSRDRNLSWWCSGPRIKLFCEWAQSTCSALRARMDGPQMMTARTRKHSSGSARKRCDVSMLTTVGASVPDLIPGLTDAALVEYAEITIQHAPVAASSRRLTLAHGTS